MVRINDVLSYKNYEYIYLFVMVIYMAQMTIDTASMVAFNRNMSMFAIFLPFVLTVVLVLRNKVSFADKKLFLVLSLITIWIIIIIAKYGPKTFSSSIFLYYAVLVAYIQIKIYDKDLFPIYEHILTCIAKLSIVLWLFSFILPDAAAAFFRLFPDADYSKFGYNFLYLFNWMDPLRGQVFNGISRNAGCSWEPGRFAIMLILAITFNLARNGIKFKHNNNIFWLLIALATTFSTTGYSIVIVLYSIFYIKKFSVKYIVGTFIVLLPCFYFLFQLDFISNKLQVQIEEAYSLENFYQSLDIADKSSAEYVFSLERFPSMIFEWQNVINDPIFGYGFSSLNSHYYKSVSQNTTLSGGLVKVLGNLGLILGFFCYYILFKSSQKIGRLYNTNKTFAVFVCIFLSSVSYVTFAVPIYTAVWLYSLFSSNKQQTSIQYYKRKVD